MASAVAEHRGGFGMKEFPSPSTTGCPHHLPMRLRRIFGFLGHLVSILH
jgi:hypothetical protein